jgi:hypothetical protein
MLLIKLISLIIDPFNKSLFKLLADPLIMLQPRQSNTSDISAS